MLILNKRGVVVLSIVLDNLYFKTYKDALCPSFIKLVLVEWCEKYLNLSKRMQYSNNQISTK